MFVLILLASLWWPATAQTTAPRCVTLVNSSAEAQLNPCSGVVNYPYLLPPTATPALLRTRAAQALNSSLLSSLPLPCQQGLVRMTCARIYRKCQPGIVFNRTNTFNFQIYQADLQVTYPVAFQRPCVSVCTDVVTSCQGTIYQFTSSLPNCSARFDYSQGQRSAPFPRQYDITNNAATCYVPALPALSTAQEKYAYVDAGRCSGFVNDLYLPAGTSLNQSFAVLQRPNVVQNILVNTVEARANRIPLWLSPSCAKALHQFICYQAFPMPQRVTVREILRHSNQLALIQQLQVVNPNMLRQTVVVPSYPQEDICLNYAKVCAGFMARAQIAALIPNCSARTSGTSIRVFPRENQTVARLTTATGLQLSIPSSPNAQPYFSQSEFPYQTQCPYGFVVPEHPVDENVIYVSGTGCALACRVPLFTDNEWESFYRVAERIPFASIVFCAILYLVFALHKESRSLYHLIIFSVLSLAVSIASGHLHTYASRAERFCYDNAVQRQQTQGDSPCTVQGVLIVYTFMACSFTFFAMAFQSLAKQCGWRSLFANPIYYAVELSIILLVPIIPVATLGGLEYFGFFRSAPWCSVQPRPYIPKNVDFYVFVLPVFILITLSFFMMTAQLVLYCRNGPNRAPSAARVPAFEVDDKENGLELARTAHGVSSKDDSERDEESREVVLVKSEGAAAYLGVATSDVNKEEGDATAEPQAIDIIAAEVGMEEPPQKEAVKEEPQRGVDIEEPQKGTESMPTFDGAGQDVNQDADQRAELVLMVVMWVTLLGVFIPFIVGGFNRYDLFDEIEESLREWSRCSFAHYDGTDAYLSICGENPSRRPGVILNMWQIISLTGSQVVVVPAFLLSQLFLLCFSSTLRVSNKM